MEKKKIRILLVEDDTRVCSFINTGLTEEGFEITIALNGQQGYAMAATGDFDLLILDIMLPEMNGLDICKAIRERKSDIPILFLTALGSSENIAMGLNSGADDYLTKPFKFIELIARINSLLRRYKQYRSVPSQTNDQYEFQDILVNDAAKTVTKSGIKLNLTSTEYKLLLAFIKAPGIVLSRAELLEKVWGVDYDIGTNVVDVYVNYLRKKLEKGHSERVIQTVFGMGYILKDGDEDTQ
ncbi:response regulator transcription factor [Robertkochia solimangrovi]|uniref:response regulator transcription factor n=1 Tax=Robertkochia solimangrovi TaxID=2213046 RepID=UPI001180F60C|nr:response regulator transcription factor [Robertkochia solimangrovi]TRZ45277.1 DNA-binding response regulator [Robertkochia solimangrovi]